MALIIGVVLVVLGLVLMAAGLKVRHDMQRWPLLCRTMYSLKPEQLGSASCLDVVLAFGQIDARYRLSDTPQRAGQVRLLAACTLGIASLALTSGAVGVALGVAVA